MRALIQRVSSASVEVSGEMVSSIHHGLLILLGIEDSDTPTDIAWLAGKISRLRIFDDADGLMNLSIGEVNGEIMVVSQFTLFASTQKGNRPSFIRAAKPEIAVPMYEQFLSFLKKETNKTPSSGVFGAMMKVNLVNNGPVTIWMDTKQKE